MNTTHGIAYERQRFRASGLLYRFYSKSFGAEGLATRIERVLEANDGMFRT